MKKYGYKVTEKTAPNFCASVCGMCGGREVVEFEFDDGPDSPTFGAAHALVREPGVQGGIAAVPLGVVGAAFPPLHMDSVVDNGDAPEILAGASKAKARKAKAGRR